MIRVYTASRIWRARQWIEIYQANPRIHFTSRWPYLVLANDGQDGSPEMAPHFWQDDLEDVKAADVVLIMADHVEVPDGENLPRSPLRGALVEAGAGLALGKWVVLIGKSPCYGTWQYHPSVVCYDDLDIALTMLAHSIFKTPPCR